MKNSFFFVLLLSVVALAGCETDVNLPEPPHTPRVALAYTLTTAPQDSSFQQLYDSRQLYVSSSQRVFDLNELPGRTDATVELRDAAGQVVERYRPLTATFGGNAATSGYYRPVLGFLPQPGQTYTLRAAVPGLEKAESTLTMPQPPVIESATYTPRAPGGTTPSDSFEGRLTLVVRDDPNTANYYLAYAHILNQNGQPGGRSALDVDYGGEDNGIDIAQFQLSDPQQKYTLAPFADTGVNGKRISLTADVRFYGECPRGNCPPPGYIEVYVSSITPEAYNFYLSRRRYFESDGSPFAEPASLISNIRPGYGLFGGAADATYRIRL